MREENENLMEALVRAKIEAAESQGVLLHLVASGVHVSDHQIMHRVKHAADLQAD